MTRVSFKDSALYATRGLFQAVSNERNIKIQLVIGAVIVFISVLLDISKIYLITIITVGSLVIILEMFNRGFEKLIDLVSPDYNREFGKVKDAMAGVVLATFLLAITVSALILYEPLKDLLLLISKSYNLLLLITINVLVISIIILTYYIKNNHK
ncbi:MAG TPA: diacylglycerol kinase family protein [Patescibacteria group bacterium]|nr:diacylglycerol kinase family protein [Patescibacteria group bacterium]